MEPARTWVIRCAVLTGASVLLAAAQAALQPLPEAWHESKAAKAASVGPQPAPDAAAAAERQATALAKIREQFESGSALFVDARPIAEFRTGHVPGAFHLDFESFSGGTPEALQLLPREFPLVVYCGGGDCDASHKVKMMLDANGYSLVEVFEPGFPAWQQAGLPVETGDPAH